MTAPMKLAGFAALLALVFGAATLAGSALDPLRDSTAAAGDDMAMGDAVRGLAVSDSDGLTLDLVPRTAATGKRAQLAFRVHDDQGRVVREFDVEHTKRMHVIVVRRDMTDFQHLHPTERPDGTWTTPLTVHDAGSYRVFADFSVGGKPHTLADDIQVNGAFAAQKLPAPTTIAIVDGFDVRLVEGATRAGSELELRFVVTRDGRRAAVQDYLGAKGHLVALRRGDLAYLHVHPDTESLTFDAAFPSAGMYRLFLQFKVDGRVHTAAFTQKVSR